MTTHSMLQQFDAPLAIEMTGVTKRYGKTTALDGFDLSVPEGAVFLLIGPNGAGKSTSVRTLLDLTPLDSGFARVMDLDAQRDGAAARARIGYVPESSHLPYRSMTAAAFLRYHARYFDDWDTGYERRLCEEFAVDLDERCGSLSKGHARRLQLVAALAHRPSVLLFDEPADGLDPLARDRFFAILAEHIATTPTTVVISSHIVFEAELLTSHVGLVRDGRIVVQLERDRLDTRLKRYVFGSGNVTQLPAHAGHVVFARGDQAEREWIVWGDERSVTDALLAMGSTVRSARSLPLAESVRVLIGLEEDGK